jgi:hypothetical protein
MRVYYPGNIPVSGLGCGLKWYTHAAIAEAIARSLDLSEWEERALVEGTLDPDINPDLLGEPFGVKMSHHHPINSVILDYIWEARSDLLMGDRPLALLKLGRALHYVQDKCVGFSSWSEHDRKEAQLEEKDPDLKAIRKGVKASRPSPRFVQKVVEGVNPQRRASKAMSSACYASAAIAATVLLLPPRTGSEESRGSLVGVRAATALVFLLFSIGLYGHFFLDHPILVVLCPLSLLLVIVILIDRGRERDRMLWNGD